MVAGAADLLSRRGVHATSLRTVVQHTGTPRGSLSHHFPGGKQELLEEAVRHATDSVAIPLEALLSNRGAVDGLRAFIGWWRKLLESSAFEAGCPVLAVAVEPMAGETGADERAGERLRELAQVAFERWETILATALRREGLPAARARRLGALTVASIEGTVAMCRAARSAQALDDVQRELESILSDALSR
jgi:AcrR family transcriptional regulator